MDIQLVHRGINKPPALLPRCCVLLHVSDVPRAGGLFLSFTTSSSIALSKRRLYGESKVEHGIINWQKDYQGEFVCPVCNFPGMIPGGKQKQKNLSKNLFRCPSCHKWCLESCEISIVKLEDPVNIGVFWYSNYKINNFICPECEAENIYFLKFNQTGLKKRFICKTCYKTTYDSINLTSTIIARFSTVPFRVNPFDFEKDEWDLRAINPNFDIQDFARRLVYFKNIYLTWFKKLVKQYILYLSQGSKGNSYKTIASQLSVLRKFSDYLNQSNVSSFEQINRRLILNYLTQNQNINKHQLGTLRNFFTTGTLKGWFTIDQDVIRDNDYPKQRRSNPEPLSEVVREQIEQNLYKLPDPIARMWIICFFAAMRPSELALLKKDCLVQEGQYWKLIWHRKKTNDYHEVPISRTIAKVVQEQQEYIEKACGKDWEYLFCHYHGLVIDIPNFKPVRKVIPSDTNRTPLARSIQHLIVTENILDENGQIAKFKPKLLRSTRLTQLFEQGHDLAVVSAWAGHRHFATTSTYYTEVSCELMARECGHIQQVLVNIDGHHLPYESLPSSFWKTPQAHKLELSSTHINTPIYGYCGLPLEQDCHKFRACYTCIAFVAVPEKLSQYILTRDELRAKESQAKANGQDVLVEQFKQQADQLEKIIASLQTAA